MNFKAFDKVRLTKKIPNPNGGWYEPVVGEIGKVLTNSSSRCVRVRFPSDCYSYYWVECGSLKIVTTDVLCKNCRLNKAICGLTSGFPCTCDGYEEISDSAPPYPDPEATPAGD